LPDSALHTRLSATYVRSLEICERRALEGDAESDKSMTEQSIQTYRDLDVWNVAMELAVEAYGLATQLPSLQRYEMSSQIRRAATSVPANVAEGHASGQTGVFLRHVRIALGSLGELDTHFELGQRLRLLQQEKVVAIQERIGRTRQLLHGLRRSLLKKQMKTIACALALVAIQALWLVSPVLG
jgi:four helix bundle protein